jgi:hypothetical protein
MRVKRQKKYAGDLASHNKVDCKYGSTHLTTLDLASHDFATLKKVFAKFHGVHARLEPFGRIRLVIVGSIIL